MLSGDYQTQNQKVPLYLVVNDGDVGSRRERHSSDATDVFPELSPHLEPPVTGEGPEHSVDEIPLWRDNTKSWFNKL